jgi:hypothetical protein
MPSSGPEPIRVRLELGGALRPLAESPGLQELERDIAAQLSDLMLELGIEGRVGVATFAASDDRALRVRVEGRETAYPPSLLWRTWLALAGRLDAPLPANTCGDERIDGWLHCWMSDRNGDPVAGLGFDIMDYLSQLTTAIVARQPGCLLAEDVRGAGIPASLLRELLNLGISVGDREGIKSIAAIGASLDLTHEDAMEAAFAELRPHRVLLVSSGELALEGLRPFIELFYADHGVWPPAVELVREGGGARASVRVNLKRPTSAPLPVAGTSLLLEPPEEVRAMGVDAIPAVSPLLGGPATIVATADAERLPLQPYGQTEVAGIALYLALLDDPGALLCLRHVERALVFVESALGDLVQAALERISIYTLTRVLRGLVRERISIRNMRVILDRLLRYQAVQVTTLDSRVLSDGLPMLAGDPRLGGLPGSSELLAFLRLGLADEIRRGFASEPVPTIQLAASLESRLTAGSDSPLTGEDEEQVRDAALQAVAGGAEAIVTALEARERLRAVLEPVLPRLPVVAEPELRGTSTNPVSTLAVAAPPRPVQSNGAP